MSINSAVLSENLQSRTVIFIPRRSAASLGVLRCEVTEKPSFCHAVSPPSRTQTFEKPFFCKATATLALVNSAVEEQYRISQGARAPPPSIDCEVVLGPSE